MAAALANGGSADDIMPGIQYFAELKASGNLIPTEVTQATVLSGETPIASTGATTARPRASRSKRPASPSRSTSRADGVYGGYYAQGVVKDSPHPTCAKLWVEHILSDEGALGYLEGGAMPARFAELVEAGLDRRKRLMANLPPAELLAQVELPDAGQIDAANQALTENWGPMVADA